MSVVKGQGHIVGPASNWLKKGENLKKKLA